MSDLSTVLNLPAERAAKLLLGAELVRLLDAGTVRVRIVEVEAYDESDSASHSFTGMTARTAAMYGPAGHLYVYFTYGMHYCCNVVTGSFGHGAAVLIRAVEPISGFDLLRANRKSANDHGLTNGPAKLCQALKIDKLLYGHDLSLAPLKLNLKKPLSDDNIVQTTRLGIRKAVDVPWRFYEKDNPYVSSSVTYITRSGRS